MLRRLKIAATIAALLAAVAIMLAVLLAVILTMRESSTAIMLAQLPAQLRELAVLRDLTWARSPIATMLERLKVIMLLAKSLAIILAL